MVAVNGLAMRGSFSPTTQYRVGVMRQRFQERVVRDAHQRVTPRPAMTPRSRTTDRLWYKRPVASFQQRCQVFAKSSRYGLGTASFPGRL
jgi:hypothetical protein